MIKNDNRCKCVQNCKRYQPIVVKLILMHYNITNTPWRQELPNGILFHRLHPHEIGIRPHLYEGFPFMRSLLHCVHPEFCMFIQPVILQSALGVAVRPLKSMHPECRPASSPMLKGVSLYSVTFTLCIPPSLHVWSSQYCSVSTLE